MRGEGQDDGDEFYHEQDNEQRTRRAEIGQVNLGVATG